MGVLQAVGSRPVLTVIVVALGVAAVRAQCTVDWQPGLPCNGPGDAVHAQLHWDADGAGPHPGYWVIAGEFDVVHGLVASRIAARDLATGRWQPLGLGVTDGPAGGTVRALAAMPGGRLVIAGTFSAVGGVPVRNVAVWDGAGWAPLGAGLVTGASNHQLGVRCLAADGGGGVYAGGGIVSSGLTPLRGLAHWDGTAWRDVGGGVGHFGFVGQVNDIAFAATGILVCGSFDEAGGVSAHHIARWDGVGWNALGLGLSGAATCMHATATGDVFVGGYFSCAGGTDSPKVARWDGQGWQSLHAPFPYPTDFVLDLTMRSSGELVVAGALDVPSMGIDGVAEWDGAIWSAPMPWTGRASCVDERAPGQLMVAGHSAKGLHLSAWTTGGEVGFPAGVGVDVPGRRLCPRAAGGFYLLGPTSLPGGVAAPAGLSRFDGTSWHSLAATVSGGITTMRELPGGDLLVVGDFAAIDGVAVDNLAIHDGTGWSSFGGGANGGVLSLDVADDGRVLIGGRFTMVGGAAVGCVAEWDGQAWSDLSGGMNFHVHAVRYDGGGVLVGGLFSTAGGLPANKVARFEGGNWLALGPGLAEIPSAVVGLPSGGVLAATYTSTWQWDRASNTWSQHVPGPSSPFALLPNGAVVAAIPSSTGDGDHVVARWHGSSRQWLPLTAAANGDIASVAVAADGRLLVTGAFTRLGGEVAMHVGEAMPSCAATVADVGSGCGATPGALELRVSDLPWAGGVYRAHCAGIAPGASAWTLFGYGDPMLPLAAVSPLAGVGCSLRCENGVGILAGSTANGVLSELRIPDDPTLAGVTVFHQVLELAGIGGVPQSLRSSNAVRLTVGVYD